MEGNERNKITKNNWSDCKKQWDPRPRQHANR